MRTTTVTPVPAGDPDVYARLASDVEPLPVYAPTSLPQGAQLAACWSPVITSDDPASSDGSPQSNPYVVGSGEDAEIEVVYKVGEGWLVVILNYRGDLGDVTGQQVGTVDGRPAVLYAVNGGELVQWSRDGRWYGVFGRGVSREALLATALGMRLVQPGSS